MKQLVITFVLASSLSITSPAWAMKKVLISNLPFATSSDEVSRLASGFGPVLSIKVSSIDNNGKTSTRAVVTYEDPEDADSAIDALDGFVYLGTPLRAKPKKDREIVVVGSKVKDVVRSAGLRSDGELVQAVSDKVHEMLDAAIKRAEANKRGTVRPYDL